MIGDVRTPRSHLVLLVGMTLLAIVLGWIGLDYCLPHAANNDEIVYYSQYRAFVEGDEEPEKRRRFVAYPAIWTRPSVYLPRSEMPAPSMDLATEVVRANHDHIFLRRCVVVLGSLSIAAAWLLARRFVGSGWALVTAGFVGTSVLAFCLVTQSRPHSVALPAIVLAVAASVEVVRRGTMSASLLAGLASGAAIAALQNGAAVLLPLAAAHALRLRSDWKRAIIGLTAASVVVAACFFYAYPAALAKVLAKPFAGSTRHGFLASHGVVLEDFQGGGFGVVLRTFAYHDPLLLLGAAATLVAGIVVLVRRRTVLPNLRDELLVVLAFCVPYVIALGLFERTFFRFALPLVPFAALFTAIGLRALGRAGVVLAAGILVVQTACIVQIVRLHVAGDTAEQAAAWIDENLDRHTARIAISPWVDLPLVRTSEALAAHGIGSQDEFAHWLDHQRAMDPAQRDAMGWAIVDMPLRRAVQRNALAADPAAFIRALDADYVLVDVFAGRERPIMAHVREGARATGRLIARFTPQGPDEEGPQQLDPYASLEMFGQDRFVFLIFGARALGTGLELYRIER